MRFLFACLFLVFASSIAIACSCGPYRLTPTILNSMDYIALVKVKEQLPFTYKKESPVKYQILTEEVLLLKGNSVKKIAVDGAPPDSKEIRTSCDMGIRIGEEWLIIAKIDSNELPVISMCGFAIKYRSADGFRDWQFKSAISRLDYVLANLEGDLPQGRLDHENSKTFYPNGNTEKLMQYKNGKREGASLYYYPDGKVNGRVTYKKDSLNGKSIWYERDGSVKSSANYKMGHMVDSVIHYMYPNVPFIVAVYSKKGVMQKSLFYQGHISPVTNLKSSYLSTETFLKKGKRRQHNSFNDDGTLRNVEYYDNSGKVIRRLTYSGGGLKEERVFDKKTGKLLPREDLQ